MKFTVLAFYIYGLLNFVLVAGRLPQHADGMTPIMVRMFSGIWMTFYAVSMSILYSVERVSAAHLKD